MHLSHTLYLLLAFTSSKNKGIIWDNWYNIVLMFLLILRLLFMLKDNSGMVKEKYLASFRTYMMSD